MLPGNVARLWRLETMGLFANSEISGNNYEHKRYFSDYLLTQLNNIQITSDLKGLEQDLRVERFLEFSLLYRRPDICFSQLVCANESSYEISLFSDTLFLLMEIRKRRYVKFYDIGKTSRIA